jgi:ribosomal protein S27AE
MKHSRLYSVAFNKCPRCAEGDFFITKSAYSFKFDKMNKHCPNCGENLVPEPGFYQGALYMSYAFYVVFMLAYFLVFVNLFGEYLDYFLYSIIPVLIILTPYFYRLARRSWLAIFITPRAEEAVQNIK